MANSPKRPVGRPRSSTLVFVGVRIPRLLLARVDAEAERRRVAGEAGGSRSAVIVEAVEECSRAPAHPRTRVR